MPFLRMTPAPGDEHSGLPSSSYQFATHRFSGLAGVLLIAALGCATLLSYHYNGVLYGRSADWVLVEILRVPQPTVSPTRRAPSR